MKRLLLIAGIALGMNSVARAEGKTTPPADAAKTEKSTTMTPEMKKEMADMYQKMADCLRTEKSLEQCSHDAMKNCPVVEKTGHCPINEGTGAMMGKGMKHPMGGMKGMEMKHSK